jgi:ATP-binding cassette, subfamily B, bacterial PglK
VSKLLRQLHALLSRREQRQLLLLAVGLIVRAAVEAVGVGSIAPFMSVVADPTVVSRNRWLLKIYTELGFTSMTGFLTAMGLAAVAVLALSNTISAVTQWGMLRFSWGTHHRLSNRLLRAYLSQPYSFFVNRNSASLNKTVLYEVQSVISGVMTPVLTIASRSLVVLAITALLIALNPLLAVMILVVLGGSYGGLYSAVKAKQRRLGRIRIDANKMRFQVTAEAFGGIKDVKVLQREDAFASRFAPPSWEFSKATAGNAAIAQLPRYLFETIAFGGIVLVVLYYLRTGASIAEILPVISLYAFAGYRLMPELQQLFGAVTAIRFNEAALDDLTADFARLKPEERSTSVAVLPFKEFIGIRGLTFTYPGSNVPVLDQLTLEIPRNSTVGLVGASGSGKTTLVDLLLGLYEADEGEICIDGVPLTSANIVGWRKQIGYVPQQIFLTDDTVANNIAFGIPQEESRLDQIKHAARVAHLDDFVRTLPLGYDTIVGERGVRLSGGQRQRIGIARALYHDPTVLIMDEATSALDGATEGAVMDAILALTGHKTIVLIAHRLSTVQECDCIFVLAEGRLVEQGTYAELVSSSVTFRSMARLDVSTDC